MSLIHIGTATSLAEIATADISNNDIAYIWLNDYTRKMVFDSIGTKAEDTTNHPYVVRPDDYSTGGVWLEDVGADQPEAWSMDSIRTGELVIDDDGSIHSAGKTNYADTDAGFFLGYDTNGYKINFGDESNVAASDNFFFKIDTNAGTMSIRLADGQTFQLYGGMTLYDGADITLGLSDTNPAIIKWGSVHNMGGATTTSKGLSIWPNTTDAEYFSIGIDPTTLSFNTYNTIALYAGTQAFMWGRESATNYAFIKSYSNGNSQQVQFNVSHATYGSKGIVFDCQTDSFKPASGNISLGSGGSKWDSLYLSNDIYLSDDSWIGLGSSSGRIIFRNESIDEISILDAGFGGGELSSDPANPSEGNWIMWMSDGTGSGDDGDIMMKITAGGSTKTATLVDFSAV